MERKHIADRTGPRASNILSYRIVGFIKIEGSDVCDDVFLGNLVLQSPGQGFLGWFGQETEKLKNRKIEKTDQTVI